MASLYQKGGKLYLSIYHNGKRVIQATGLEDTKKNRKLVETDLLPNVIFKVQTGQIVLDKNTLKTVGHYARIFLDIKAQSVKAPTIKRYQGILTNYILPAFEDTLISQIKVSDLRVYINHMQKNLSGKTIDLIMIVFNGIFQEAIYDEEIDKNPFIHIRRVKTASEPAQPLCKDEVQKLLSVAKGWFKNFLGVAFFSGMRTGEMLGLKWEDVSWVESEMVIARTRGDSGIETTPKTLKSRRIIPIFDELRPYLESQYLLTGKYDSYVFLNSSNEPFRDSHRIRDHHWKRALEKCGIEYRRLYDTRSTFATMMVSSNLYSVNLIAQILGHADVSMLFRRYNKFIKNDVQKMSRKLGLLEAI